MTDIPTHRFGCATGVLGGTVFDKLDAMSAAGFAATVQS